MKLTEEIIQAKMRRHMELAKKELAKAKPEKDPDIAPIEHLAIAVWNNGIEKSFPGQWKGVTQKQVWGQLVSKACELSHASAVLVRCIGTGVISSVVAKELNLNLVEISIDEWHDRLYEWVERTTGQRRLSGLPERFRSDHIVIFSMGPRFKESGIQQPYEWRDGAWRFPPSTIPDYQEMKTTLVPKWWQ